MELIREIGTRAVVSKTGKSSSRKWGVFKCPSCSIEKEYSLQKGTKNKSCGRKGCRATTASFNSWNSNMSPSDKKNTLPYYTTFASQYMAIKSKYKMTWTTLEEFSADMYDSFVNLRNTGHEKLTLNISSNEVLAKHNCKWVDLKEFNYPVEPCIDGVYNTLGLVHELHIAAEDLTKVILGKYPNKCKEVVWPSTGIITAMPLTLFAFTHEEYLDIRSAIRESQRITTNTSVYAIRMVGTQYVKVGKTSNINNRLDDLTIGSPYDLEVLFNIDTFNIGKIEQRVHKMLHDKHVKGEWFELSNTDIDSTKKFLIEIIETP